jgi:hypothetical protein
VTDQAFNAPLLMVKMEAIVEKQAEQTRRLDDLAKTLAESYVAKGEWAESRKADERRFGELEKDNEARGAFNRQLAAGLIIAFVIQLVLAVGVINNARGG